MPEYQPGRVLMDRFEIMGVLGRGGMATVYLAMDRARGERIALKVLHEHLHRDPASRERLRREVLTSSRLRHPGALLPHDLHDLGDTWALSLPFHPGRTLAEYVEQEGPLEPAVLRGLALRMAQVLEEAHGQGILHRDISPANLMMGERGAQAVLTDFGLARLKDTGSTAGTGMLGTSGYAAPEIYEGLRADPRSDLYGLGAVLYLAATGTPPFAGANPMSVLKRQVEGSFRPILELRPEFPVKLAATVEAMIAADPERRPAGALELKEAIEGDRAPLRAELPTAQASSALARTWLPEGEWTVVVRERPETQTRSRRQARRAAGRAARNHRRATRRGTAVYADPGEQIRHAMLHLKDQVVKALGLPEGQSPERFLASAVAREAGLPDQALEEAQPLMEARFQLVRGVARETADRLAADAQEAGFDALVLRAGQRLPLPFLPRPPFLPPAIALLGVAVVFALTIPPLAPLFVLLGLLFLALSAQHAARSARQGLDKLPLAYPSDLRPLLSEAFRGAEPRVQSTRADVAATPEKESSKVEKTRSTKKLSSGGELLEKAEAALLALERAIESEKATLPEVAHQELKATVAELQRRARTLAAEADQLETELRAHEARDPHGAVASLESRLDRLATLERAGEPMSGTERARLESELQALRESCATAEALETSLTARISALLDITGTASRVRRALLEEPEPSRSVEKLASKLKRQVQAAAVARRETA